MRRRAAVLVAAAVLGWWGVCGAGEPNVTLDWRVEFADQQTARRILTTVDDHVRAMSPFDRMVRLEKEGPVSQEEYLAWVGEAALEWSAAQKQQTEKALGPIRGRFRELGVRLPETVYLIQTTGQEEGGSPYTRQNAVMLPRALLRRRAEALGGILAHELYHVMTRANQPLRQALYGVIGFEACEPIELPPAWRPRRISNPDAPHFDAVIRLEVQGRSITATLALISKSDTYHGGGLMSYLLPCFLEVEKADGRWVARMQDDQPVWHRPAEVEGLKEKVGENTGYLIHPEEILADNFGLPATGRTDVSSPEIMERMELILRRQGDVVPPARAPKTVLPFDEAMVVPSKQKAE